jgi:hypothetical protein
LDGIWLSPSVRLTVSTKEKKLGPLTLAIPEPGVAGSVKLVDARGKPIPGGRLAVARPEGPLAKALWPAWFTADGAGVVRLPPLEAGTHQLRLPGGAKTQTLVIPALTDPRAKAPEVRLVVE